VVWKEVVEEDVLLKYDGGPDKDDCEEKERETERAITSVF